MPTSDIARVRHILDPAREAMTLCQVRQRSDLDTNRLLTLGLTRLLETVGEAASGVSPAFRERYPSLPWRKMAGMRDRIIHGHFDVNLRRRLADDRF